MMCHISVMLSFACRLTPLSACICMHLQQVGSAQAAAVVLPPHTALELQGHTCMCTCSALDVVIHDSALFSIPFCKGRCAANAAPS